MPAALVGRESQLTAWDIAIRRISTGRDAQSLVLYGLRGVGKTVLLTRFAQMARDRAWIVAQVEAKSGRSMRAMVGEALHDNLVDLARPGVGVRVLKALKTALSFKASYDSSGTWSFGLDLDDSPGGGADTGTFESDLGKLLRDLSAAAEEGDAGLALLVDEAQDLPEDELIALCSIVHAANQRQDRLVVALAGLPSLPRKLAEAKSYAERLFSYHTVDALTRDDAIAALESPAETEGASWQVDAMDRVIEAAGGYPYFLQQYGQETWNVAPGSPITFHDAQLGVAEGQLALDNGFFRIRWERATSAEKEYLRAMAVDGDRGSASGEVAARLHKKTTALGPARANLINKGLIYSPDHGMVAYTVPAMAAFVQRQESAE
ncbi:ATP-binding protein [Raineyella antarctica]|uniref:ATP-binding protein n=1 Tax=Raineyella antarctica TaxID=1577474 RepID=UPI001C31D7F2|nr:ATP-binding protein [Raineyella antarctica]